MTYALAKKKGAKERERGNEGLSSPRPFSGARGFRRGRRRWTTQRGEIREPRDIRARVRLATEAAPPSEIRRVASRNPLSTATDGACHTQGAQDTRCSGHGRERSRTRGRAGATARAVHVAISATPGARREFRGTSWGALPGALVREHGLWKHLRAPALHTKKMACYEITSMTTMSSPVRLASLIDRVQSSALLAAAARVPLTSERSIRLSILERDTRRRDSYELSRQFMISFLTKSLVFRMKTCQSFIIKKRFDNYLDIYNFN